MRSEDIAWAAGLFEGEGCFFVHRSAKQTMVGATLSSVDRDVVERFAQVIGVGHVRGPLHDGRPDRQPIYHWRTQAALDVKHVIEVLSPWLCKRRTRKVADVLAAMTEIGVAPKNRTHCPKGHEYTEANTLMNNNKHGHYRKCRACLTTYKREWYRRQRATAKGGGA